MRFPTIAWVGTSAVFGFYVTDVADYGSIFADQVYENGSVIEHSQFSNVRVEVELAFVLKDALKG